MQKRKWIATVLVFTILIQLVLPAAAQIGVKPVTPPPDTVHDQFDLPSVLANPLLFSILRSDEEKHPERVFLRVDDMRFQTAVSTSGSLTKVAQYEPLDTGVKVKNLFYQREYATQVFSLMYDYEGCNSSRLEANLAAPNLYHLTLSENQVYHRLEQPLKVDFNLTPGADYERKWQRLKADGDVSLSKGGEVKLYGGIATDHRDGTQAHSYFELHRFNCTDCHTLGFGQNVNYRTEDWYGGASGRLNWMGGVVDARFRSSNFDNLGSNYTYNFGGSLGRTSLFPTSGSRDSVQEYQAYFGPGDAPWRVGAHLYELDRSNAQTGASRTGQYISVQAGGRINNDLSVTGSYYSQNENNSVDTTLSNDKQRILLQATWTPLPVLGVTGRLGLEDRQYKINDITYPTMHDTWEEVRADWRPIKQFHLQATYRNDDVDHPYFPTDFAHRSNTNVQAAYATGEMTAGFNYDNLDGSNPINAFRQTDFVAFVTARILKRYLFSTSWAETNVNANVSQQFWLPMPQATSAAITPGIGGPLFLQSGLPYDSHNQYWTVALTIPMGSKDGAFNLTPTYRWVRTDTNDNYLTVFPAVPLDSQVRIVQSVYGLRLDVPLFSKTERLGLGWEHDSWKDAMHTGNSGTYDLFMLNFSKRF